MARWRNEFVKVSLSHCGNLISKSIYQIVSHSSLNWHFMILFTLIIAKRYFKRLKNTWDLLLLRRLYDYIYTQRIDYIQQTNIYTFFNIFVISQCGYLMQTVQTDDNQMRFNGHTQIRTHSYLTQNTFLPLFCLQ